MVMPEAVIAPEPTPEVGVAEPAAQAQTVRALPVLRPMAETDVYIAYREPVLITPEVEAEAHIPAVYMESVAWAVVAMASVKTVNRIPAVVVVVYTMI